MKLHYMGKFNLDAAKYIFRRCNMTVAVKGDRKKINAEAIEKILESLD